MFPECADLLKWELRDVQNADVLNVGSNTWSHYHDEQPWIWKAVLNPLLERGCWIVNMDTKEELVAMPSHRLKHVVSDATAAKIYGPKFDMVLCTSMLEHVESPRRVLDVCHDSLKIGGILWLELPSVYPIHHDPIDNGLRITTREQADELLGPHWGERYYWHFDAAAPFEGKGVLIKAVAK